MPPGMRLDCALIDSELGSQFLDWHTVCITLDQLLQLGWTKTTADSSWGSSFGGFGPRWDHFEEVPETFSLVRMVQVTSHYLHSARPVALNATLSLVKS